MLWRWWRWYGDVTAPGEARMGDGPLGPPLALSASRTPWSCCLACAFTPRSPSDAGMEPDWITVNIYWVLVFAKWHVRDGTGKDTQETDARPKGGEPITPVKAAETEWHVRDSGILALLPRDPETSCHKKYHFSLFQPLDWAEGKTVERKLWQVEVGSFMILKF